MRTICLALVLCGFGPVWLGAEEIRLTPDSKWFEVLHGGGLNPGDEVILAPGVYSDPRRLEMNHRGEVGNPIVIRATGAILRRPDARQNSLNMAGCQHLALHGLEITGGSAGIRIEGKGAYQPKHLHFEGLHIHHIGGVAITANHSSSAYDRLVFRGNHIHHTSGHGEGFYLGGNNAADGSTTGVVRDSIVERNYIHHLDGPQISQGDGIEFKDGSYGNIIRDNVIHDTNYPGIIVYGTDGKKPNVIERNVVWNTGDHAIQAAADAIIRNNIIFDTGGCGIYSRDHQSAVVGRLEILHNTIVTRRSPALRIIPPGEGRFSGPVTVANNAFYAPIAIKGPPGGPVAFTGNAGRGEVDGRRIAADGWLNGGDPERDFVRGERSFFPSAESFLRGKASPTKVPDDFNGTARDGNREAGAYRFDLGGNPGWAIEEGFKEMPGSVSQIR